MLTYRYQALWDAIDSGVLSGAEADALKAAAEAGTVSALLEDWGANHSDQDFRQVCVDTLALMQ